MRPLALILAALLAGCSAADAPSSTTTGTSTASSASTGTTGEVCTPFDRIGCSCAGGESGLAFCLGDGGPGECVCNSGSSGTSSASSASTGTSGTTSTSGSSSSTGASSSSGGTTGESHAQCVQGCDDGQATCDSNATGVLDNCWQTYCAGSGGCAAQGCSNTATCPTVAQYHSCLGTEEQACQTTHDDCVAACPP